MDNVLSLLIQAHGETLGRMIWGAHQLAATAAEQAQQREAAESEMKHLRSSLAALSQRGALPETGGDG